MTGVQTCALPIYIQSVLKLKKIILYIYSTNTGTEYLKRGIHSPFFSLFKMQFVS